MAAFFLLASCAKPEFTHRVAVVRFENLTPDAASDWIGRAASEEIAGQLEGTRHNAVIPFATLREFDRSMGARPVSIAGDSTEAPAAIAAGANRIVAGYYTVRSRQLTITALEENLDTRAQTLLAPASGSVDDLLHLTDQIARSIDDEAAPPITGSARALRSYALGLESPEDGATPLLEEASRLDPDFGPAYVALARIALAKHDEASFESVFAQVRARGDGVRALDRALLNLEEARLHAPLPARIDQLAAVVRLLPADPFRLEELADAELQANRYAEAVDHYRKLVALLPSSSRPLNLLGYALMYSGDEPSAMKAFADFRKADPGGANPDDSKGDAQFFFNHFDQAEQSYLAALRRNPDFAQGTETLKAAWCRLMQNDLAGARRFVDRYRAERGAIDGAHAASRAEQIESVLSARQPPVPPSGELGEAVAALERKDYGTAVPLWRKLAETLPPSEWYVRTVYARALIESGQTQEAARFLKFTAPPDPASGNRLDSLWYPWILSARHNP